MVTSQARQELRQAGWAGQPELIRFQPDSQEELRDGGWERVQELGLQGPEWALDPTVMVWPFLKGAPWVGLRPLSRSCGMRQSALPSTLGHTHTHTHPFLALAAGCL